jgi:hydrogenase maturation protease
MPTARIVCLGQPAAGDDGVGPAVARRLRQGGPPPGVEVVDARDASELVELVQHEGPVVIVDALLGEPAGRVVALAPEALSEAALTPLSSHGLSAGQALALARRLAPGAVSPRVVVVGVTIAAPRRYEARLSPEVAAAVGPAAEAALAAARAPSEG